MKQVINDVAEKKHATPDHQARRRAGLNRLVHLIFDRTAGAVETRALNREQNVQRHGNQKHDARAPENRRVRFQEMSVIVYFFRTGKDLKITGEVTDHESEKNEARQRNDDLLSDRGSKKHQIAANTASA